jgi:hypothetical protein
MRCSRRNSDDSAEVFSFLEARDLYRATVLGESRDLRETMPALGVVDKPDICFVEDQSSAASVGI